MGVGQASQEPGSEAGAGPAGLHPTLPQPCSPVWAALTGQQMSAGPWAEGSLWSPSMVVVMQCSRV